MADKIVAPILYVCRNQDCDFSTAEVGMDGTGKPRIIVIKTRKGNEKPVLESPPYGVVSAKPGEKAICPVCGTVCTEIEDGRHKFLRLNSQRVGVLREKMRLIGNTMKGAQYDPTESDIAKVQKLLYAEFDVLSDLCDKRVEKIKNPGQRASSSRSGQVKVKIPFAL